VSVVATKQQLWTRREYDRIVEAGVFGGDDRIELLEGEIIEMIPQNSKHAAMVTVVKEALDKVFAVGFHTRFQMPLGVGERSEPEPDIAVVNGSARDYLDAHPQSAVLVVEVSDSSIEMDRVRKRAIYASADVPEYWIVDLVDERLGVYSDPRGGDYRSTLEFDRDDTITPIGLAGASISVAKLLP
jgi:Uma2 family endonuclease